MIFFKNTLKNLENSSKSNIFEILSDEKNTENFLNPSWVSNIDIDHVVNHILEFYYPVPKP